MTGYVQYVYENWYALAVELKWEVLFYSKDVSIKLIKFNLKKKNKKSSKVKKFKKRPIFKFTSYSSQFAKTEDGTSKI